MQSWFETPPGRYLHAWEEAALDEAVADIFGFHALQLGQPGLDTLRANRMPHRWLALPPGEDAPGRAPDIRCDPHALPFDAASLDLVVLPHTLEMSVDPHGTLREVERVLMPEGKVVICGLNPASLWGLRQRRAHLYRRLGFGQSFLPEAGEFIGWRRMRDWLRLLGFEIDGGRFGCYRPPLRSQPWLERWGWMEKAGDRWWPVFGAVYTVTAIKRVRGMRLIGPAWRKTPTPRAAPAVVSHRHRETHETP